MLTGSYNVVAIASSVHDMPSGVVAGVSVSGPS